MNNTTKILLAIILFLICAGAGFIGGHSIATAPQRLQNMTDVPITTSGGNAGASGVALPNLPSGSRKSDNKKSVEQVPMEQESASVKIAVANQPEPEVTNISAPVYNASNGMYTFTVTGNTSNLTYHLADSKGNEIGQGQRDGTFVVSPVVGGVYNVFVTNADGFSSGTYRVSGCTPPIQKITTSELQTILNSGDASAAQAADFKNRVSPSCRYEFSGWDSAEGQKPESYNEIINRINMGIWSGVTVTGVSYDNSGRISQMNLSVTY